MRNRETRIVEWLSFWGACASLGLLVLGLLVVGLLVYAEPPIADPAAPRILTQNEWANLWGQISRLEDATERMGERLNQIEEAIGGRVGGNPPPQEIPTWLPQMPEDCAISVPGQFHSPALGGEQRKTDLGKGTYSALDIQMDVNVGPFRDHPDPAKGGNGLHALMWLRIGDRDGAWKGALPGYANLIGRESTGGVKAKVAHSLRSSGPKVTGTSKGARVEPGDVIRVRYRWTRREGARLDIWRREGTGWSKVVAVTDIKDDPPAFHAPQSLMLIIGHPAEKPTQEGPEVATYGWSYGNLCATLQAAAE